VVAELDFSGSTPTAMNHLIQTGQTMNQVTRVGFLIVQKSSMTRGVGMWTSDGGTDMYINDFNTHIRPNGTVHIFALTGRVSEYSFSYTGTIAEDPYANDVGQFESTSNVNSSNRNNFPQDRFYRQPFKWSNTGSEYDTGYTFEGYQIAWDAINNSSAVQGALEQRNSATSMHRLVSSLSQLKHQEADLINGRFEAFSTGENNGNVMSYRIIGRTKTYFIYLNFGSNSATIPSLGTTNVFQWNNATSTNLPAYSVLVRR
jgi:hypothetical protein